MMYGANHHIENIGNHNDLQRNYSVVGNRCETDIPATNRKIAIIRKGDRRGANNAGAYGDARSSN
jgi:Diaminopimelate decarboxylase